MDMLYAVIVIVLSYTYGYLTGRYIGKTRTETKVYVAAAKIMTRENVDTVSGLVDEVMYK